MLVKDGELISSDLRRRMDKAAVLRMAAGMLDGSGYKFKPLKNELVIMNPLAPEKGRVRIEYATGHVSWQREVWEFYGPLQGFETEDDDERYVGADKILSILRTAEPQQPEPGAADEETTHAE